MIHAFLPTDNDEQRQPASPIGNLRNEQNPAVDLIKRMLMFHQIRNLHDTTKTKGLSDVCSFMRLPPLTSSCSLNQRLFSASHSQTLVLVRHVVNTRSSSLETLSFFLTLLAPAVTPLFVLSERWIHMPCGCFINCKRDPQEASGRLRRDTHTNNVKLVPT